MDPAAIPTMGRDWVGWCSVHQKRRAADCLIDWQEGMRCKEGKQCKMGATRRWRQPEEEALGHAGEGSWGNEEEPWAAEEIDNGEGWEGWGDEEEPWPAEENPPPEAFKWEEDRSA